MINTCNFLAACSCVGRLAVIYFMPRCSFSALCPVFIAFLEVVTMYIWSRVQRVKMGAYIHAVLICMGTNFTVSALCRDKSLTANTTSVAIIVVKLYTLIL